MSNKPSRFKTTIDGRSFTIVGRKSQEHMRVVSDLINDELTELKKVTRSLDNEERAILLAINAKSEQLEMQKKVIELEEKLKNLSE
ncbi:MAG TPA: cell division protein ZapA [Alloiococcus sp.]|nr:cell division protein ZapA [Alloiococcus sp.]